ncbi:MAG: glycine--tRNA ligase subunit beta [Betaproteobacteria bacterium]|nr:glycine--tRNA ligase subunit beta [Betaproteobacteria bacterium]
MNAALLIELRTEELPPRQLARLGDTFATGLQALLAAQQFVAADTPVQAYASPRRLGLLLPAVSARQPDRTVERRGPSEAAAFKPDGTPTPALTGFARSCGVPLEALTRATDAKGQTVFAHVSVQPGQTLAQALPELLATALSRLPVAKVMRWGAGEAQFVRPVHGLVALHGAHVLPVTALGLTAGRTTLGHRFLSRGPLDIARAEDYAALLETQGHVLADFGARRARIAAALKAAAGEARVLADDALLDEVTALVEWPAVYEGRFDPEFLSVPQECLILSMQQHQKYFPLGDTEGRLLPRFLLVSNLDTATPEAIVRGNERVLRARLSDARFFFEQDRKTRLADRLPRLADVVYHNRLGSMLARVGRLERLAATVADLLGADAVAAQRAAQLMKADLLTDMVGEFPELQGLMGRHYALHDGEAAPVADAIAAHYHPRFAQDSLPQGPLGSAVALADKLDTLAGMHGIGQAPTGDRDPFGLRRAALGVIRILMEQGLPLELPQLLQHAVDGFPPQTLAPETLAGLTEFLRERLRGVLRERGYSAEETDSVLSQPLVRLDRVPLRLDAVRAFRALPEAQALAAANKRIRNLLRKSADTDTAHLPPPDPARFAEAAEHALHDALMAVEPDVDDHLVRLDYTGALCRLASLRDPVDRFFTDVMVLCEDAALRANRLALLARLERLMNQVADISRLGA